MNCDNIGKMKFEGVLHSEILIKHKTISFSYIEGVSIQGCLVEGFHCNVSPYGWLYLQGYWSLVTL